MEPKQGMVATNGQGVLGLLIAGSCDNIWTGIQLSGPENDIGRHWCSVNPKVLCHISDLTKNLKASG